jgi:hypothetical protein
MNAATTPEIIRVRFGEIIVPTVSEASRHRSCAAYGSILLRFTTCDGTSISWVSSVFEGFARSRRHHPTPGIPGLRLGSTAPRYRPPGRRPPAHDHLSERDLRRIDQVRRQVAMTPLPPDMSPPMAAIDGSSDERSPWGGADALPTGLDGSRRRTAMPGEPIPHE